MCIVRNRLLRADFFPKEISAVIGPATLIIQNISDQVIELTKYAPIAKFIRVLNKLGFRVLWSHYNIFKLRRVIRRENPLSRPGRPGWHRAPLSPDRIYKMPLHFPFFLFSIALPTLVSTGKFRSPRSFATLCPVVPTTCHSFNHLFTELIIAFANR